MPSVQYAVTDVETTGLFPKRHDRIVEIAVVRVDSSGRVLREFATLVNPERDVGATHIHGISASDVLGAPTFAEIAGDVLDHLRGAIFVAHNVSFDWRFVSSEFRRIGHELPEWPNVCTLDLACDLDLPITSRKLACLCDHFGIELGEHHSALDDARATALLLNAIAQDLSFPIEYLDIESVELAAAVMASCPTLRATGRQYHRKTAREAASRKASLLETIIGKLPTQPDTDKTTERYLDLLDRALEDRYLSEDEESGLLSLAQDLGLSAIQVRAAHERYFLEILRIALLDGVITKLEQEDLEFVRRTLGIKDSEALALLKLARQRATSAGPAAELSGGRIVAGKSVCFTGELRQLIHGERVTREQAEEIAKSRGMVIRKSVTKKLDYLVVADAASASGKANKARQYGTRVIAEATFWQMVS